MRDDFARQLKSNQFDVVGITGIIVNVAKVREMCRTTRQLSPHSVIIVGGHVAAIPGIEKMIDADHIVKGEGVSWMRRYLAEDESAPIRHPAIVSGMRTRIMGIRLPERKGATAATIIPSVGCPMGCNFCTTSAFFGGKGKFVNFFETGGELFELMSRMEDELKVNSFFVMDENFLLHRERAMRLLELMKHGNKSWALSVFASANAIRKYTMLELVELGVSWLCGWAWNRRKLDTANCRERTRGNSHANCASTEFVCKGRPSLGWNTIRRTTSWRKSARGLARHGLSPVHVVYAGAGDSAVPADVGSRANVTRCGLRRRARAVQIQFQACSHFSGGLQTFSGLGFLARLPAQRAEPLPHFRALYWRDGSGIKTRRMRACGHGLRARWDDSAECTVRHSGRWNGSSEGWIRMSAIGFVRCGMSSARNPGSLGGCCRPCSVRCCCGRHDERRGGWREERHMSRRRFWS
jgi:hypothetical protein